jgi:hypothetical protein
MSKASSVRFPPIQPTFVMPSQPILHAGYIEYKRKVKLPIFGQPAVIGTRSDQPPPPSVDTDYSR